MLSKLHTQNFALLMVAAAIILGGDYFVRDLIHTIKSKASAADLHVLQDRVAKLEQKPSTIAPVGFNVPPLPSPSDYAPQTSTRKPRPALTAARGMAKDDTEDGDKDQDNGKFVLMSAAAQGDTQKSDFKLLGAHD